MAQVDIRAIVYGLGLTLVLQAAGFAQSTVPSNGIAAETSGHWDEAIRVYRAELERNPTRADLWARIADINSRLDRPAEVVLALRQATHAAPADSSLYFRLSQALAGQNAPREALRAAETALSLRPADAEYLDATGTLATWNGEYGRAQRAYRELQARRPTDPEVALKLARVSAWAGLTDESATAYRRYLGMNPEAAAVWLELARTEAWRGNSANAIDALNTYRDRFGASRDYSLVLARVLSSGGRPGEALDVLDPLLRTDPQQYDAVLTQTVALTMARQIGAAVDALRSVRRLDEANPETKKAERLFKTTLGSTFEPGFTFYGDSDRLQVVRFFPTATLSLTSGTRLTAGYERDVLAAPQRGGLGQANGQSAVHESVWAGAAQTIGRLVLSGRVGTATTQDHQITPYAAAARLRADRLTVGLEHASEFLVISPKTVELGLTQERNRIDLSWDPTLRAHVSAEVSYQQLSDGNRRWEATITPRRAFARTDWMNLDLGVSAYVLGTSRDLPNGYYDPHRYESYEAAAFPYFKLSENVGLSMSLAAGVQRENSSSFQFGGNAGGELTIGIYRAWLLKTSVTATQNRRLASGAFQGYAGAVTLVKHF